MADESRESTKYTAFARKKLSKFLMKSCFRYKTEIVYMNKKQQQQTNKQTKKKNPTNLFSQLVLPMKQFLLSKKSKSNNFILL